MKNNFLAKMYLLWIGLFLAFSFDAHGLMPPPPPLPGGLIAPPVDCDDNAVSPKFYQEPCTNDTDCFGNPHSMICTQGKCQCAENNVPDERFVGEKAVQKVCVPAPTLFTKCTTTCQKPAVCLVYSGEGGDGKTKVCQCPQPYRFENGFCYLTCGEDEYYEPSKYKCIKRCKQNQVPVNDTCVALVDLNGQCQSDSQCQTPFSECKSGVCVCKAGFTAQASDCIPQTVSCPNGDPLKKDNKFVSCRILESSDKSSDDDSANVGIPPPPPRPGGQQQKSDCPTGHFCLVSSNDYYVQPSSAGYCCPLRPDACPIGSPHPSAKCGPTSPQDVNCPWNTHFCQSQSPASGSETQLCCPKSCPSDFVQVDKKCLPRVHLGNACSSKQQCSDSYSDCIQGICKCQAGAKQTDTQSYRYCSFTCEADEVLFNGKCRKRLKLADTCTPKNGYLCPEYGRCSPKNQCVCQCGAFTLADNVCAPPPICRPPWIFPGRMEGPAGAGGAAPPPPPPPIPRISDEDRDKLLKNTTFCKVKGKNPPAGVKTADKCAETQYCSSYITNLGICCSKPKPNCPMGGQPKEGSACDPKNPLSCGLDKTCVKYLYAVDQDENSKDYTICCSSEAQQPNFGSEPVAGGAPPG